MSQKKIKFTYENAWKALIKIDRYNYNDYFLKNYLNGNNNDEVEIEKYKIKTSKGETINSTYYKCKEKTDSLCIYLHTRGGSQLEGLFIVNDILPKINYLIFDFVGSGKSTGEYISLGPNEADDLNDVILFIKNKYEINNIVLWGRSMGAVTIILYINKYYTGKNLNFIKGIILDSPFAEFNKMVVDLIKSVNKAIPGCLVKLLLFFILKTIKSKIGINLSSIKPINLVENINIPCIYLVAKNDIIARPDRVKELFNKHNHQEKEFYLWEGEHQTLRDKNSIWRCILFIYDKLINK